jgi:glycosyltransferase involved in cell wall biosynthesis
MILTQSNLTLMGGAERTILRIAQHYSSPIYTAEYDRTKTFPEYKEIDIRIIAKGTFSRVLPYSRATQGLDYGLSFYNYKIKDDYDVIGAHIGPSHWIRNRNERVLWHCHTPLRDIYDLYELRMSRRSPYKRPVYKLGAKFVRSLDQGVVKKIELIMANGNATSERIRKYYNRNALIIGTGVDCENFYNDGDGKFFFYPSRFSPNKRQEYAIESFRLFRKKMKGYKLVLCGSVSTDPEYSGYYKDIVRLAARVGDVKVLPGVSEERVRELFSRSTAVLYVPRDEDLGVVPLEAMASRKPSISVNEGGPKEVVKNNATGFLVDSPEQMAAKMLDVVKNPSLAEKVAKRGFADVRKNYSWSAFFKRYDSAIKRMLK